MRTAACSCALLTMAIGYRNQDFMSNIQRLNNMLLGSKNWENKNTFGRIETIADRDYKNPAYYNVPVSSLLQNRSFRKGTCVSCLP